MTATDLLPLLHLCDSLFPIGAFSHSDGLEAATSSGRIRSGPDLAAWMAATIGQSLRHLEGPAAAAAWRAQHDGDPSALQAIDEEVYALRPSAAGRQATRAMGTRLLNTWRRIRPQTNDLLQAPALTLPVAFGAVCAASGIRQEEAVQGYAYTRLSATVSAALRLMSLGQHEGHQILAEALAPVNGMVRAICDAGRPLAAFTPLQDLATMQHQYLHSRLFRS